MRERDLKPIRIGDKKPLPVLEKTRQRVIVNFLNAIPGSLPKYEHRQGTARRVGQTFLDV